ncbi:MAG: tRNA uridine-5-carboxymethylaminomethyl(34) synthesis enzyme MnmG [Clostridia bacterium]|nr:tRNA uridine-5-carboxymethylaminomethyl(34) synthesis enzyme MnmG [Clostridia bacterium]
MVEYLAEQIDVAVIGGGHAGCEAALAAARLGCRTVLFSVQLDAIANLPCNPSIGGTAKGHLVREIDALGGEMGKVADKTLLQSRILNRGKGPAVYSLRAQIDRKAYQREMKHRLELQENLTVKQGEIVEIRLAEGKVASVMTELGAIYEAKAVVLATGTFLAGRIIIGDYSRSGGPDGFFPANELSACLKSLGVQILRFKTGTPARINRRSVDFSRLEVQEGDETITPFSFETDEPLKNTEVCHLTYTNENTHQVIRDNLHRSPLYSGVIEGVGPRYCPSIEDKVVRFAEKERHQVFIEPMGGDTEELYVQGMSSSLPEDVQIKMLRTMVGLEKVEMMRTAYAIEYDCIDSTQLKPSLEFKEIPGLFGAGQFNGSSGYEEAAAQGLMAGINAAHYIQGKEAVVLDRSTAYIGVLIDDLVTKGTPEPYRMMTARAEYRLLLRQDNADLRLTELGHQIGLISDARYQSFLAKKAEINREVERLEALIFPPSEAVLTVLNRVGSTPITTGIRASELLRRPEISYALLAPIDPERPILAPAVAEQVEITVKYQGYIERQMRQAEQFLKLENRKIPDGIDYEHLHGLRLEARQKLAKIRPRSVGQASRISGVSPADITVLLIYLKSLKGGSDHGQEA